VKYITNLITSEEERFNQPITITDQMSWNFPDHVEKTVNYMNSVFHKNHSENKPFKNILAPILNLQYRAEGFDVKDIVLYVDSVKKSFKSLIIKKYHERWALENGLDTFIDKMVESYVNFGGALIKKVKGAVPKVVPLQGVAFCDQSDMLSGPICEKHFYSPDDLRVEAEGKGWDNVELAIINSEEEKESGSRDRKVKTPGKNIKVYELHGMFPRYCLDDEEYEAYEEGSPETELVGQVHIAVLYQDEQDDYHAISLFKGEEKKNPYKVIKRGPEIYGRALGKGGGEELFQDQIWANYGAIRMKELLDAASKVLFKTTDPAFANRNKTDNLASGEILVLEDGKDINQLDTTPRSTQLFDNFIKEWELHARQMGAANESILGESPTAGTPFKLQELITSESHSLHEYRKGQLAVFLNEIYREWIIPGIVRDINKGQEFLAELDVDELQSVADSMANFIAGKVLRQTIWGGPTIDPSAMGEVMQYVKENVMRKGGKQFAEALKDELKSAPVDVKINIAGKQKDLAGKTDKLVNLARFMLSTYNPQTGQFAAFNDPRMAKLLNQVIEWSGLDPVDFSAPSMSLSAPVSSTASKPLQQVAQRPSVAQQVSNA